MWTSCPLLLVTVILTWAVLVLSVPLISLPMVEVGCLIILFVVTWPVVALLNRWTIGCTPGLRCTTLLYSV